MLVLHCNRFRNLIPVSFVLGFFVSLVVNRWWGTYQSLPWPDTTAILVATHIRGQDAEAKNVRANILRYVNLAIAVTFSMVSPAVKKKFPSLNSLMNGGYLTEDEVKIMEVLENRTSMHKTWIPIMWACKVVEKARRDGIIQNDSNQRTLISQILSVRGQCGGLLGWNEYNIPLVYTQVVTIAVYSFFLFSLFGEQFLDPEQGYSDHIIDIYIPLFALLQLFFYIGWIKVAEALLNPFGEDDHDFEFIPLLERHLEMSALLSEPNPSDLPATISEEVSEQPHSDEQNGKFDSKSSDFIVVRKASPVETIVTTDSNNTFVTCQMSDS